VRVFWDELLPTLFFYWHSKKGKNLKMAEKRILLVDDDPDMLMLTSTRLKKFGYDVILAVNGKGAIEIMRDKKPDLVLLDMVLPAMSGARVCKEAKNDETLKQIPIILFTAYSDIMTAEKAKTFGADSYITKPLDMGELKRKIEEIITKKERQIPFSVAAKERT
jgi:DNA-binding response OmpR family regulator